MKKKNKPNTVDGLNYFRKKWGHEIWFANNELYCGKEIFIRKGHWSSGGNFHYHKEKDETFYVISGELIIDFSEDYDQLQSITLNEGQSFRIQPYIRHRFTTNTEYGCVFIEASTHHDEKDSYRCKWDEKKSDWVDYTP